MSIGGGDELSLKCWWYHVSIGGEKELSLKSCSKFTNLTSSRSVCFCERFCGIIKGFFCPNLLFLWLSWFNLSPLCAAGNLRHLIVESCIARNLLDTSAYFWPGYANGNINQLPHTVPTQIPTWSAFMKGAPLTPALTNALISSPASRYACVAFLIQWFSLSTLINQAVPSYFTECESTSPVYYLDKGILLYEYLRW